MLYKSMLYDNRFPYLLLCSFTAHFLRQCSKNDYVKASMKSCLLSKPSTGFSWHLIILTAAYKVIPNLDFCLFLWTNLGVSASFPTTSHSDVAPQWCYVCSHLRVFTFAYSFFFILFTPSPHADCWPNMTFKKDNVLFPLYPIILYFLSLL